MVPDFENIVLSRHIWTFHEFINKYGTDGSLIFDDLYNIPSVISHLNNDLIETLVNNGMLIIYGVFDKHGYLHVNKDDFDRLKLYLGDKDPEVPGFYVRKVRKSIVVHCMDYRCKEESKKDFWTSIINYEHT